MPLRAPAVILVVTALLAGVGPASAQPPATPNLPRLAAAAAAAAQATPLEPPPAKKGKNPVVIGAIAGAIGAAALTALAARQYGENEGGGMCGACLVQWGTIAVPAGAGIGAGIGWIVEASAPDPRPARYPPSTSDRTKPAGWRQDATVTIRF